MKLFTLYTKTNQWQFDEFLKPSLPPCFDLQEKFFVEPPNCLYKEIIVNRNLQILRSIEDNDGKIIAWCDTDVQFFDDRMDEKLLAIMEDKLYDIGFQHEVKGKICCGFQVIRCSEETYMLYSLARESILNVFPHRELIDQAIVERKLRYGKAQVKWGVFPDNLIWCPRRNDHSLYHPDKEIEVPEDISCHHANWTREFKREQLERVKKIVESRKFCVSEP